MPGTKRSLLQAHQSSGRTKLSIRRSALSAEESWLLGAGFRDVLLRHHSSYPMAHVKVFEAEVTAFFPPQLEFHDSSIYSQKRTKTIGIIGFMDRQRHKMAKVTRDVFGFNVGISSIK